MLTLSMITVIRAGVSRINCESLGRFFRVIDLSKGELLMIRVVSSGLFSKERLSKLDSLMVASVILGKLLPEKDLS